MEELEKRKKVLEAIRQAIAITNLESDFNVCFDENLEEEVEKKIKKLGGMYEKLGRLRR